ncbi:MAG: sterol desaturase family protein [Balneolaceae bacterium]
MRSLSVLGSNFDSFFRVYTHLKEVFRLRFEKHKPSLYMPRKVDRALSYVFITPNMHKLHQHYTQPLTNTNYGNIFAIWDRLSGTYAEVNSPGDITYGIDTHMNPEENDNIVNLLKIAFQEYRPPTGKDENHKKKNK